MTETDETARAHDLSVRPEPTLATGEREAGPAMSSRGVRREHFDQLIVRSCRSPSRRGLTK